MTDKHYALIRHQDKAAAYISALRAAGFQRITAIERAAFLLSPAENPRTVLARDHNVPTMYYPEAAIPPVFWDGTVPVIDHTCSFVHGTGHEKVMRAFGYEAPIHVTGWTYSPLVDFKPRTHEGKPMNVLFGPWHPNSNGWLSPGSMKTNGEVFERLFACVKAGEIKLTVRHVHSLADNGLEFAEHPNVAYDNVLTRLVYEDLDRADVVVAVQSLRYLAIARGVPAVTFDNDIPAWNGHSPETYKLVANWDKYKDLLRYPLDLLEGVTMDTLHAAAKSDAPIAGWRREFVGEQFRPREFVEIVERYLA